MTQTAPTKVARYKGLDVFQDENGFYAQNGWEYAADGDETLEDAQRSIDAYWASDKFGPLNGFFTGADQ